jgi:hypothetical protein
VREHEEITARLADVYFISAMKSRLYEGSVIHGTRRPFLPRTKRVERIAGRMREDEQALNLLELRNCETILGNPALRKACDIQKLQTMVRRIPLLAPRWGEYAASPELAARAELLKAAIHRELHLRHAVRLAGEARASKLTKFHRDNIAVHARRGKLTLKDMKKAGISARELEEWGIAHFDKQLEQP